MEFEKHIENRHNSESYSYFELGQAYYRSRNTLIMERKKKIFLEEFGAVENPFGANHRLPSGHFKKIVDQKVMYALGEGVKFTDTDQSKDLDQYFEDTFDEIMIDLGVETSKKSEAWLMAYKKDNKLKFTKIPAEQLTPIWNEYGDLKQMIRNFEADGYIWAYVYDDKNLEIYRKKLGKSKYELVKKVGHWSNIKTFSGQIVDEPEERGFGVVPFIQLWNNREKVSDLYGVKPLIDTYDIINSDFANNIDDMQDAYFTLKGYSGDAKDLGAFMRQLKQIKAVPVGEDGALESHQLEIPTEARKVFLERIENDIYKFAMAVDLTNLSGGSITNVYIKSMFADLDLKCDQFESELRKFIKKLIEFINSSEGTNYTYDCNFVRSTIINNNEVIDGLVKLSGIISNKTIRELQPFEIDLEQEDERIAEQQGEVNLDQADKIMKAQASELDEADLKAGKVN